MAVLFLSLFRFARLLMSGHGAIAMENGALRLQLAAFQRKRKRSVLSSFDRLFWVGLSLTWNGWRAALSYVQPDTVVRWQRERFRKFLGTPLQGEPPAIRPTGDRCQDSPTDRTNGGCQSALERAENSRRIVKMLGIQISERAVSQILRITSPATDSALEDVSSQPPRPTRVAGRIPMPNA
jgi:hypothetical protein